MTRTERLTERAIGFAIAETDEDLALARLAFLAQEDLAALDKRWTLPGRRDHTLYTRWRAISFLVRSATGPADPRSAGRFQRQPLE